MHGAGGVYYTEVQGDRMGVMAFLCKRIQNMHSHEVSSALGEACASTVMEDPSFPLACSQEP